jgi:hypothetical protein
MIPEASLNTGGLVEGALKEAATAKVTVQNLRRNISILTGDTFWNRDYPFIDYASGGSIEGCS